MQTMSLLAISKKNSLEVANYRIDQVVALAGDGKLRDGNRCSLEFREYLRSIPIEKISLYIRELLSEKFTDSGFVLQDLINEVGRRLGFEVTNGRYHGVAGQSGHDGYWSANEMRFVVEVKTTDAYRINLSTLASYAKQVHQQSECSEDDWGILIVVGRQDTGDLEAQIRGSKFAWDVRVISAEALIDLAKLFATSVDQETSLALQQALLPVEYTRVDHLVNLLSRLAFDVERSISVEDDTRVEADGVVETPIVAPMSNDVKVTVDQLKANVLHTLEGRFGGGIQPQSKSRYVSADGNCTYFVTASKNYARPDQQYWYALQSKWVERMRKKDAYLCLGLLDQPFFFLIPGEIVVGLPEALNKTEKPGSLYWHIGLCEDGDSIYMSLPKKATRLDLNPFKVNLNV